MEYRVPTGQWVAGLEQIIVSAHDGDTFVLPSNAHAHAFDIAQNLAGNGKQFKVRVQS